MTIEIHEKPLTRRQRKELHHFVATSTSVLRVTLFVLSVGMFGAILRGIQIKIFGGPPLWALVTVAVGMWFYIKSKKWTGGPEFRKQTRRDLEAGVAKVTVIEPAHVTEIDEVEDEGPSYIIESKKGESILLTGQWLVRTKKRQFPWSKFEIAEAPHSGHFFGIRKQGEPIPISAKRDAPSYEQAKKLGCFDRNYILLDETAKKLLRGLDAE